MPIWDKLTEAASFASPVRLRSLLTSLASQFAASVRARTRGNGKDPARQIAFTIAVISLSAKMAKADGVVTSDEIAAFRELFDVPEREVANVRRLFNLAKQDVAGYDIYARQIARMFRNNPAMLEDLLDGLFHIAKADGVFHPGERAFLRDVAAIFGFSPREFHRICLSHGVGVGEIPDQDPYLILGVDPDISDADLKRAYRRIVRENHPDAVMARGVPKEFVAFANDKLAAINDAYDRIREERGVI